jgi:beta-xylosidase
MRQALLLVFVAALSATLVVVNSVHGSSHAIAATALSPTDATVATTASVATSTATTTAVTASATGQSPTPKSATAVVYDEDFPDPFVLTTATGYVAFSTNSGDTNVPELVSNDLANWTAAGDALPTLPAWARESGTWAPSVAEIGGAYVMYITLFDTRRGRECLFTASAATATGPYAVTDSNPLQCAANGSIDASVFSDANGALWLTWKNEAHASQPATIVAAELNADGRSFASNPTALVTADEAWEGGNVEGPSMIRSGDHYVLFFSTGAWTSTRYSTGYATCTTPVGPCAVHDGAWLSSADGLDGPGGLQAFTAADGSTYVAFHTWVPCTDCAQWKRILNLRAVDLSGTTPRLE